MNTSADFSWQLLLLASAISGDPADFDTAKDATLGVQLKAMLKADAATNGPAGPLGRYGYPGWLIDLMEKTASEAIGYRNRIVHDTWTVLPSDEHADAVQGEAPTTRGRRSTYSTLRGLEMVGLLLAATAGLASAMQPYLRAKRRGLVDNDAANRVFKAREGLDYVRSIMTPENGWLWQEVERDEPGLQPVVPAYFFITPAELAEEAERARQRAEK